LHCTQLRRYDALLSKGAEVPGIDVKKAVAIATQYFHELIEYQYADLELEEVELSEDGKFWFVTLGFTRMAGAGLLGAMLQPPARAYKVIKINAATGEPEAMKMRVPVEAG